MSDLDTATEVNVMLERLRPILNSVLTNFPQHASTEAIWNHLSIALRDAVPLNPAPEWAASVADEVLIDWQRLLFDDTEQFNRVFKQRQQFSFQAHFAELDGTALAAQLASGSELLTATRRLAEVLTAAVSAGLMIPRLDPTLFVLHEQRIDADWEALAAQTYGAHNRLLKSYDLGWMHPALRKREIPNELSPAAATTHAFAYLILHTLTRLPPAANQASLLNQIERFRVYNPRLPAELCDWLREWLRLSPSEQRTPFECWQALAALVQTFEFRQELAVATVGHDVGGDSVFGRNKRRNQNEDCLFILDEVPGISLLAVADGVSTAALGSGGQASFTVRETGERQHSALLAQLHTLADTDAWEADGWALIEAFFENCHRAVVEKINGYLTAAMPPQDPMSSTLVLALVRGNQALIGHWGDSRAYRLSPSAAVRLTEDHNCEMEALMASKGSRYEQPEHRDGAPLVRVIGQCRHDPDAGRCEPLAQQVSRDTCWLTEHDWLLLCSDGLLSGLQGLDDAEKERRMSEIATAHQTKTCRELARQLVKTADDDKGDDNITAVVLRVHRSESATAPQLTGSKNKRSKTHG